MTGLCRVKCIVILHVRGRAFDKAATRAHLLGRRRARSVPLPTTTTFLDQQQLPQQDGSPPPSPKRSRATSPTSTATIASPLRLAVDPPFDPSLLSGYRLRLSLIPFGPGSEVYGSAVSYMDLETMAAMVVPPPRPRLQQQQQRPVRVRADLFEETASAPGAFDREEDREEGEGPSSR
jgi:hypothetical protein